MVAAPHAPPPRFKLPSWPRLQPTPGAANQLVVEVDGPASMGERVEVLEGAA